MPKISALGKRAYGIRARSAGDRPPRYGPKGDLDNVT